MYIPEPFLGLYSLPQKNQKKSNNDEEEAVCVYFSFALFYRLCSLPQKSHRAALYSDKCAGHGLCKANRASQSHFESVLPPCLHLLILHL